MAEDTAATEQAAPAPAAPSNNLIEQYDLGDTVQSPGAAVPPAATESPAESSPPEAPRPLPPRDEETGRFLPKGAHSPRIVQMAQEFGLADSEIAEQSPEGLESLVLHLSRQARKLTRDNDRERLLTAGGEPLTPLVSPVQEVDQETRQPKPQPDEDEFEFNPAEYEPNIAKAMLMVKTQRQEIKELKQLVGQLAQGEQRRQTLSIAAQVDRAFEKHSKLLGEGRGHELTADDPNMIRRKAVLGVVQGMKQGSLQQRIDKAVEMIYGAAPAPRVREQPPATPKNGISTDEWNEGGVTKPTHRSTRNEPKGRALAEKSVAEALREMEQTETELPEDSFLD